MSGRFALRDGAKLPRDSLNGKWPSGWDYRRRLARLSGLSDGGTVSPLAAMSVR